MLLTFNNINKHKIMYHIIVILLFTIFYYFISKHYGTERDKKQLKTVFDSFYLSTTTHSTIGYGDIAPESSILRATTIVHVLIVLAIVI